ncbi:MAG TPA: hypothetical protein DEB39_01430 [Planctomycetaceae bacterium]|nr:hypothetical protein [Planctomycetaceae bacterium]
MFGVDCLLHSLAPNLFLYNDINVPFERQAIVRGNRFRPSFQAVVSGRLRYKIPYPPMKCNRNIYRRNIYSGRGLGTQVLPAISRMTTRMTDRMTARNKA